MCARLAVELVEQSVATTRFVGGMKLTQPAVGELLEVGELPIGG